MRPPFPQSSHTIGVFHGSSMGMGVSPLVVPIDSTNHYLNVKRIQGCLRLRPHDFLGRPKLVAFLMNETWLVILKVPRSQTCRRNPLSFVGNNPRVCESVDPKSDAIRPFSSKIHQSDTFQLSRRSVQQAQSEQCPCSTIGR